VEVRPGRGGAFNAAFAADINADRAKDIILDTLRAEASW
jgi:purine nucleosidase